MHDPRPGPAPRDVASAAILTLPFAIYLLALAAVAPPTELNWRAADPILTMLARGTTLWMTPAMSLAAATFWWRQAKPGADDLRAGVRDAAIGAASAAAMVLTLRLLFGPALPWFIPPEESSAPGFLLSMTAGLLEEVSCRLGVMPALYFALRGRLSENVRALVAVASTGVFFAAWHAAGDSGFSATFFATRFLVPGCAMSAVWLWSPSAVVTGHCTAHLLIPALFVMPRSVASA